MEEIVRCRETERTKNRKRRGMAGIRTREQRTIGTKTDALTHYTTEEEWKKSEFLNLYVSLVVL